MNKSILKEYLNTQIAGLKPEKQLDTIDKIIIYIKDYREKLHTKILRKYILCSNCKKYYPIKSYKIEETDVNSSCLVYSDCGYGDDDEYAKCIYHIKYRICPKCGEKHEFEHKMTWRGPSYTRDGRRGCF